jgi:predicted amidophosphoribosyltransferase
MGTQKTWCIPEKFRRKGCALQISHKTTQSSVSISSKAIRNERNVCYSTYSDLLKIYFLLYKFKLYNIKSFKQGLNKVAIWETEITNMKKQ